VPAGRQHQAAKEPAAPHRPRIMRTLTPACSRHQLNLARSEKLSA
jgi:hypothetical protein